MTTFFQPGAVLNTQGFGIRPEAVEVPWLSTRDPTSTDIQGNPGIFPIGKRWINFSSNTGWELTSLSSAGGSLSANWQQTSSATGTLNTVVGTGNQITVTTVGTTATVSLPAAIITPGSLTTTTTLASGTTLTAGTSLAVTTSATIGTTLGVTGLSTLGALTQVGTASINASGSAVTTIGTGGTGATQIGNATGNTAVTGSLSTTTSLTAGNGFNVTTGTTLINGAIIGISNDGTAANLSIGGGAANKILTIGSTTGVSATLIQAGSSGITLAGTLNLSSGGPQILFGSGAPGATAPKGSLYTNTTATTTTTRLYINTDGAATWASFTASA